MHCPKMLRIRCIQPEELAFSVREAYHDGIFGVMNWGARNQVTCGHSLIVGVLVGHDIYTPYS